MDNASELLFRSLTRYFIPGLVFLMTVGVLPQLAVNPGLLLTTLDKIDAPHVLFGALTTGYLLDSFGAYSWSFRPRRYAEVRATFSDRLQTLTSVVADDPDEHIAAIWIDDENTYERILSERADWVLILEASFSLWVGGVVCLLLIIRDHSVTLIATREAFIGLVLLAGSYFSAGKGIQRLIAHNKKIEVALERLLKSQGARVPAVEIFPQITQHPIP